MVFTTPQKWQRLYKKWNTAKKPQSFLGNNNDFSSFIQQAPVISSGSSGDKNIIDIECDIAIHHICDKTDEINTYLDGVEELR